MAIFRQYIAPLIVVLVFLLALVAVSARIFLPEDMAAPAPVEEVGQAPVQASQPVSQLPVSLEVLIDGLPQDAVLDVPL